jgi:hypothetical protein
MMSELKKDDEGFKALLYCPRCDLPVNEHEAGRAKIDGEPAHVVCTMAELDECGMDDYHN